jgi:hypothetical protein
MNPVMFLKASVLANACNDIATEKDDAISSLFHEDGIMEENVKADRAHDLEYYAKVVQAQSPLESYHKSDVPFVYPTDCL